MSQLDNMSDDPAKPQRPGARREGIGPSKPAESRLADFSPKVNNGALLLQKYLGEHLGQPGLEAPLQDVRGFFTAALRCPRACLDAYYFLQGEGGIPPYVQEGFNAKLSMLAATGEYYYLPVGYRFGRPSLAPDMVAVAEVKQETEQKPVNPQDLPAGPAG